MRKHITIQNLCLGLLYFLLHSEAHQRETNLLEKVSIMEEQVSQLTNNKTVEKNHLEVENTSLIAQITELSSLLKLKEEENNLLISNGEKMQTKLQNLEENYGKQKDGFVEELNKMNDVLKQRGEAITRLEEKSQTAEKEFKV